MNRIVAICLLRNEDLYLNRVLANIRTFADEILLADHRSTDETPAIARAWAERHDNIHYRRIRHPRESHEWIRRYVNQPVWAFGVDGDEIYDPAGLQQLRTDLQQGHYDRYRQLYGHTLHCEALCEQTARARGYGTPPCRTITKLYNFNAYEDWTGPCPERFHGGQVRFNPGWTGKDNGWLYREQSWETCDFRCLHTVFLPRSSQDPALPPPRQNLSEINQLRLPSRLLQEVRSRLHRAPASAYKRDKYARGELLERDITSFLEPEAHP
jgi:glycosyltransferase involved in cell wall biosynthesis